MRPVVGGALVWLVPFVVSCFLIGPDGTKFVSDDAFRTTMLLTGSATASCCALACDPKTRKEGTALALAWLAINWFLDLVILVPLIVVNNSGDAGEDVLADDYLAEVPAWFRRTGLNYIGFVSNCVVAGACAERGAGRAGASAMAAGTEDLKKQR